MLDSQLALHNKHLSDAKSFADQDPQLKALAHQVYAYLPPLLDELPIDIPGIYTITGGRQIGKSTLAKQWMQHLLAQGINPQSILYFTGEVMVDHISMIRQLEAHLQSMPQDKLKYLVIDEVTYILNWDMGVKFLADAGLLENVVLLLTGSDSVIIQTARMRFPGRRGRAAKVDYHVNPLSFHEVLTLTNAVEALDEKLADDIPAYDFVQQLFQAFNLYLQHGGYLTAINNFAEKGCIESYTLATYADWIRGDMIKRGKSDSYCQAFFTGMLKRLGSQITWNAMAKDFAIEHHNTVAEYAELLMSMDAIYIQQALIEDKLMGAPKKARKLIFNDPFIYHAIYAWLNPSSNPYEAQIKVSIQNAQACAALVESCVISHYKRKYPTFYIKSEGEVDIAYINQQKFWPVEIKWAGQLRVKDLKQIQKYVNGIILSKQQMPNQVGIIPSYPLPWYLAKYL